MSALLSWLLAAFTIECDNEAERRLPHRTANFGESNHQSPVKPWLVSIVMWFNCLRFVTEQGIAPRELEKLARTKTNLDGMRRWGYTKIAQDGSILLTRAGRYAQEVCPAVWAEIEARWRTRFGDEPIGRLRKSLVSVCKQLPSTLPDCMPILTYGFATNISAGPPAPLPSEILPLLARVLVQFALDFETNSPVSLPLAANVLRVIPEGEAIVRDVPKRSGISKEAISMAINFLNKRGYAKLIPGTPKRILLTPEGIRVQAAAANRILAIERAWERRYGEQTIAELRSAAQEIVQEFSQQSPLFACLETTPENWRSRAAKPATLPYYPVVLHRGGFPDGS